jgi:hypothetical protein
MSTIPFSVESEWLGWLDGSTSIRRSVSDPNSITSPSCYRIFDIQLPCCGSQLGMPPPRLGDVISPDNDRLLINHSSSDKMEFLFLRRIHVYRAPNMKQGFSYLAQTIPRCLFSDLDRPFLCVSQQDLFLSRSQNVGLWGYSAH